MLVDTNKEHVQTTSEQENLVSNDKYKCVNEDKLPPDYDLIINGDATADTPNPQQGMGCAAGCKATAHIKAWIFTILTLLFAILCAVAPPAMMIVFCVFAYCAYLVESFWFSSSFKYLKNTYVQESVYEYISRLQTYEPKIWWNVMCYHYETRYRTVTDSDGNTRTESYQEMVITHTASADYTYKTWKDISSPMPVLDEWSLTKLTNYKTFSFADDATENDYNTKAAAFRANNNRDVYQTFSFGVEIQDFLSKMLVEVEPGTRNELISMPYYVISTLFLCTTCFRMYFASVCGRQKYAFNKQISILDGRSSQIQAVQTVVQTVVIVNNAERLPGQELCVEAKKSNHHKPNVADSLPAECNAIMIKEWNCEKCTFLNEIGDEKCQMCNHYKSNHIQESLPKYDDGLPDAWVVCYTNDGKIYYQNNITKTTQWERP